jgi:hypothetical protein
MEPDGTLPYPQKPTTGLYTEPDVSNPHLPTIWRKFSILLLLLLLLLLLVVVVVVAGQVLLFIVLFNTTASRPATHRPIRAVPESKAAGAQSWPFTIYLVRLVCPLFTQS